MLLPNPRYALNKMNSVAKQNALGDVLMGQLGCLKGTYRFSRDGGAVSTITLKDDNGVAVSLPSKAIVLSVIVHTVAACTSGGAATIDLNLEAANDLLNAEAVASFSSGALVAGIPDFATLTDAVKTTATRTLSVSINVAALTAGSLNVFLTYILSE